MATKTRVDLIHRALRNLGALPEGQTVNVEEYNTVDAIVEPCLAGLAARNVVYLSDEDIELIPYEWFLPLGHCLAWACAGEFGVGADTALASLSVAAERDLRIMTARAPTYQTLEITPY